MKAGEFAEGEKVLRAKIDMASPNMNMRDPILYRIRKVPTTRPVTDWVIYPTYDFAHGQEDAIEGVTHSICTLEFEDHRPLYDWFIEHLPVPAGPVSTNSAGSIPAIPLPASASSSSWWTTALSRAGMIRACQPFPACGGVATPRRPFASFAT